MGPRSGRRPSRGRRSELSAARGSPSSWPNIAGRERRFVGDWECWRRGLWSWRCTARRGAGLEDYVRKPDPAFAWTQISNHDTPLGKVYSLKLTSQVWQGITWTHSLSIYEPREITYPDTTLLFITGGANGNEPKDEDHKTGFTLAQVCGARAAVLRQVPNQPLLGGKTEDELIAETFVRYLQTKDENWPLLFPMVKSAVKAMDAVQAWAKDCGKPAVTRFVVTGGSKRGWTTWLTGAMDDRVVAIAPDGHRHAQPRQARSQPAQGLGPV